MRHGQRLGRDKFIQRDAMAVQSEVIILRMGNQNKVFPDANEADRLRRSGAFIGGWHFLEIEMINAEDKRSTEENCDEASHIGSLALRHTGFKTGPMRTCARKQHDSSSPRPPASLLNSSRRDPSLRRKTPPLD